MLIIFIVRILPGTLPSHVSIRLQLQEDQSSSHLKDGRRDLVLHAQKVHRPLQLDERAELGSVVFNHDLVVLHFEEGVSAADADVRNLHVGLYATPHLERVVAKVEYVDYFRWSTLDRFQDHVVLLWLVELHDSEHAASHFVLEGGFAKLALERLPEVARDSSALVNESLAVEPLLEAGHMDLSHGAAALARTDERILVLFL